MVHHRIKFACTITVKMNEDIQITVILMAVSKRIAILTA